MCKNLYLFKLLSVLPTKENITFANKHYVRVMDRVRVRVIFMKTVDPDL